MLIAGLVTAAGLEVTRVLEHDLLVADQHRRRALGGVCSHRRVGIGNRYPHGCGGCLRWGEAHIGERADGLAAHRFGGDLHPVSKHAARHAQLLVTWQNALTGQRTCALHVSRCPCAAILHRGHRAPAQARTGCERPKLLVIRTLFNHASRAYVRTPHGEPFASMPGIPTTALRPRRTGRRRAAE